MEPAAVIVVACLSLLAIAHSALGEKELLRPLFQASWTLTGSVPRWAVEVILRFAWHLTSIAWVAIAAAILGVPLPLAVAAMSLVSATVIFVVLRGHLAWPLFALAGIAALHLQGWLVTPVLGVVAGAAGCVAVAVAVLHFYWAGGGRWGIGVAIPTTAGAVPAFHPPAWLTAGVGVALLVLAGLTGWAFIGGEPDIARWALVVALVVLVIRALGDGRQVGLTKSDRASAFAQWDDRVFTPLVVLLAFGVSAALVAQ